MTNRPAAKTYADAGVDLAAAAAVKDRIKAIAAATLGSAVIAGPGGFGGVIDPTPRAIRSLSPVPPAWAQNSVSPLRLAGTTWSGQVS